MIKNILDKKNKTRCGRFVPAFAKDPVNIGKVILMGMTPCPGNLHPIYCELLGVRCDLVDREGQKLQQFVCEACGDPALRMVNPMIKPAGEK